MSTKTPTTWAKPNPDVTGLDMAFGGSMTKLLPAKAEIPEEFWHGHTKWNKLQSDWFFSGLKNAKWEPREGVETKVVLRHLGAIQGSWEPQHEHKEAAVAWLASLWFTDVSYERAK